MHTEYNSSDDSNNLNRLQLAQNALVSLLGPPAPLSCVTYRIAVITYKARSTGTPDRPTWHLY